MQDGIKNEIKFKKYFDKQKLGNLPKNAQQLICAICNENLPADTTIQCWKSKYYEKADIKIKINNSVYGISIKTGHQCSMHQENKETFYKFLTKIGINDNIITKFDNYMIGKINNQKIDGKTYMHIKSNEIEDIIKAFNKYYIKTNLIIRFLFQGTEEQQYDCDAIIYGTPEQFIWATKDEILKYLINIDSKLTGCINTSNLNIKSYDRNLKNNPLRKRRENDIQVKWYTLIEDLTQITENREFQKNQNSI